jgi:hypothetical protein
MSLLDDLHKEAVDVAKVVRDDKQVLQMRHMRKEETAVPVKERGIELVSRRQTLQTVEPRTSLVRSIEQVQSMDCLGHGEKSGPDVTGDVPIEQSESR